MKQRVSLISVSSCMEERDPQDMAPPPTPLDRSPSNFRRRTNAVGMDAYTPRIVMPGAGGAGTQHNEADMPDEGDGENEMDIAIEKLYQQSLTGM